jgi:hypothetical protein
MRLKDATRRFSVANAVYVEVPQQQQQTHSIVDLRVRRAVAAFKEATVNINKADMNFQDAAFAFGRATALFQTATKVSVDRCLKCQDFLF